MDKLPSEIIQPLLNLEKTRGFKELMQEIQEPELASSFHKKLFDFIKKFDTNLDQEHEVGVRLVSFGQSVEFIVRDISYYNPKLICFHGQMPDGTSVQLIQHVNQISFLLLALPRSNPEQPKRLIGFYCEPENQQEKEAETT